MNEQEPPAMGMFQVKVRVTNPHEPTRWFEEKFWVDTGALYSFVPAAKLTAIGLKPQRSRDLIMADRRQASMQLGEAPFTIEEPGETLTCPVVFGLKESLCLLGATALEIFGVDADPTTKSLKPILAIIGGFLASR
jgi:predicted aspartyl protease